MIKNWTVNTQQVKNGESGFINRCNYLKDKNRPSHADAKINTIFDGRKKILQAFEDRKTYRRENGLRGGGVRNYATSFVVSLPKDIKQANPKDWALISIDIIKSIAEANDLDVNKVKEHSHVVLHRHDNKPDHIHFNISNVIDNQVVKGISQYRTTHAVKCAVNDSVKRYLGVDHMDYVPEQQNVGKRPVWLVRAENTKKAKALFEKSMSGLKNLGSQYQRWFKNLRKGMNDEAALEAGKVAESIAELSENPIEIIREQAQGVESVVGYDEQDLNASDSEKVSNKIPAAKRERKNKNRRRRKK